ncbi:MAG: hypothetical protein ACRD3D_17205 [Terriglobia bacterium]
MSYCDGTVQERAMKVQEVILRPEIELVLAMPPNPTWSARVEETPGCSVSKSSKLRSFSGIFRWSTRSPPTPSSKSPM